jgi:uncharacterized protein (TIGR00661 family)
MKKIVYGICGIGLGHMYRQLPIIEELKKQARIAIFAYGESLKFCERRFDGDKNIQVIPVAVPYMVGMPGGLSFKDSLSHAANQQNFWEINAKGMAQAQEFIGKPDAVLTDYEPVSAQYAYMYDAPLYTLDQQSKYLVGEFPEEFAGASLIDETQRLRMFFPKAHKRIIFSFFDVTVREAFKDEVTLVAPVLRKELQSLKRKVKKGSYLIYLSAQGGHRQSLEEIQQVCEAFPECSFDIFDGKSGNDRDFLASLATCEGIISTAGHSLMSEAVELGIPVYAMPLNLYEQQMNAFQIEKIGHGINKPIFTKEGFKAFKLFCRHYKPALKPEAFKAKNFIYKMINC